MKDIILFTNKKNSQTYRSGNSYNKVFDFGPIRASFVILTIQIVALLLVTDLSFTLFAVFFLRIHFLNISLPLDFHHHIVLFLTIFHILKNIFQIYFIVKIILKWAGKTYYVIDKHLIKREGIFTVTERSYDLKNIRSVTIQQSFLGKIFKFGDVVVETSASGGYMDKTVLVGVPDPQRYERILLHGSLDKL